MALRNGFPAVSGAANFLDIRRDIAGLVARDATGKIRAGVFPRHFNNLLTARADMKVDVAAFEAVLDRDGAVFLAHEGSTTVNIDAAPPANSRIDVIWVKQFETRAPFADATDGPQFGVLKGTAAASPVKPTALPAGALEIGTVQVPAGAVTTQSAGVVLSTTAPYTAASGGVIPARTLAERDAITAPRGGDESFVVATGQTFIYMANATTPGWFHSRGRVTLQTPSYQGFFVADGTTPASVYEQNGRGHLEGVVTTSAATFGALSYTFGTIPAALTPAKAEHFIANWGDSGLAQVRVSTAGQLDVQFFTAPGAVANGVLRFRLGGMSWRLKAIS